MYYVSYKQFNYLNKMKKYNIWNKIFHKKELNKNVADYKLQQGLVNSYECWLTKIGNANTLSECMILHKRIWRKGFRNANLGPDKYGMFRTKDINLMTINEVYIKVLILELSHNGKILKKNHMILHRHAMSYVLIKDC